MSSFSTLWRALLRPLTFGLAAVLSVVALVFAGMPAASAGPVEPTPQVESRYWGNEDYVPVVKKSPFISGTARVGGTVTLKPGAWKNLNLVNQAWVTWKAGDTVVRGRTAVDWPWPDDTIVDRFTVPATAAGKRLTATLEVEAEYLDQNLKVSATSSSVAKGQFVTAPTPTISGAKYVGSKLSAKAGSWSGKPTFRYQWLRNGKAIKGATGRTYATTLADLKRNVTVSVTGVRSGFVAKKRTSKPSKIVNRNFSRTAAPKIGGTIAAGRKLTANPGSWSPKATFKYQWLRNGKAIGGAKSKSYTTGKADLGKKISVRVTGSRSGYTAKTRTSAAKKISHYLFTVKKKPTITGSRKAGATLKATKPTVSPKASSYTYRWYRNGKAISGATKSTFKVRSGDKGAKISVKVTVKRKHYKTTSSTSASVKIYKPAKKRSWAYPYSSGACPASHPVKGNQSGIYHVRGGRWYAVTTAEECFASPSAAVAAGYRASRNG